MGREIVISVTLKSANGDNGGGPYARQLTNYVDIALRTAGVRLRPGEWEVIIRPATGQLTPLEVTQQHAEDARLRRARGER